MKKKYVAIIFVFLFFISMIILLLVNDTNWFYDAAQYRNLGIECGWDVKNMTSGFRGWIFPYVHSICYKVGGRLGNTYMGYWIFSSFLFAFVFGIEFACVARILGIKKEKEYLNYVWGGICGIIFYVFFRGLFIYGLSDFFAFSLALFDIIILYYVVTEKQKLYVKLFETFILGIVLYATYNIRTIYLFLMVMCIFVMTIWQLYGKKLKQSVVTLLSCFCGMFVCSVPQSVLNNHLIGGGVYSWKVPTGGLMLEQLQWGIEMERYATYVGDSSFYTSAQMIFANNIGRAILDNEGIQRISSYKQWLQLIIDYPLDILGGYVRHFLNILYPIYPNQYIYSITNDKSLLLLLFFTILFIAIFNFIYSFKLKSKSWIWLFLILLPCIAILPGAVEIRFFIALHFLIYMYAALGLKEFIVRLKKDKFKYISLYLVGFALYIAYAGSFMASTTQGIATIN